MGLKAAAKYGDQESGVLVESTVRCTFGSGFDEGETKVTRPKVNVMKFGGWRCA